MVAFGDTTGLTAKKDWKLTIAADSSKIFILLFYLLFKR